MCFHTYQGSVLPPSVCSVQVNRVLTYHDLDKDLMKYAAFQTLVSGCWCGVTSVSPFQFSTVLRSDTQLHKIHCSVIQAPSSVPASVFLSAVRL